jgi:hypothetical protein
MYQTARERVQRRVAAQAKFQRGELVEEEQSDDDQDEAQAEASEDSVEESLSSDEDLAVDLACLCAFWVNAFWVWHCVGTVFLLTFDRPL